MWSHEYYGCMHCMLSSSLETVRQTLCYIIHFVSCMWHSQTVMLPFQQPYNFPADVSFSFGGPGSPRYFVNEMHYDNPSSISGKNFVTVDSVEFIP